MKKGEKRDMERRERRQERGKVELGVESKWMGCWEGGNVKEGSGWVGEGVGGGMEGRTVFGKCNSSC